MKILVTGGAGFIGSSFIRHVLQDTLHSVVNVDKLTYAGNLSSLETVATSERYLFERIDICNRIALENVFLQHQPDVVIHFAAESHVDRSIDKPAEFIETNILGTYALLEVSRSYWNGLENRQRGVFRFHHISTDEVFGDLEPGDPPFVESTPYAPSSPYAASKASSDHLVRAWYRTYGLPVILSNCSNNYGPFQFPEKLIPHMILNALAGKRLPVYGDGQQVRDWLYVADHAKALLTVLNQAQVGDSYNIGGYNEVTNLDVVRAICQILEVLRPVKPAGVQRYEDLIQFVNDRPGHDKRYAINAEKISKKLGWYPEEDFKSGLYKTVEWYLNNPLWWQSILDGSYQLDRLGQAQH